MRVLVLAALSVVVAAAAISAPSDKKPKPVDIRKEMDEKCGSAPYGLVDLNGKEATKAEMEEAKFQVTSFVTQVDVYQECILKLAEALKARTSENDRRLLGLAIAQSQSEKEAVGAAFNDAVCEFNQKHNIPDKDCKNGKWLKKTVEQATTPAKPAATTTPAKPAKPAAPAKPATP